MKELCDILSKPRRLGAEHKLAILESAIMYLHLIVAKAQQVYEECVIRM
jgi:hypothetical protein